MSRAPRRVRRNPAWPVARLQRRRLARFRRSRCRLPGRPLRQTWRAWPGSFARPQRRGPTMIQPGALRILIDTMIPGHSNRWPAASDVIDVEALAAQIGATLSPTAAALLAEPLAASTAPALLDRLAAEHRSDASRLSAAVYRAYYTTSAVQSVIRDLAEFRTARTLARFRRQHARTGAREPSRPKEDLT